MSGTEFSVGVVVNFRNPLPGLLEKCVVSLLEQEFSNWTAYLCDDASDSPRSVPRDDRIKDRRNAIRLGMVANTVYSVAQSREDIIVHVDGDDMLYPKALDCIVDAHARGADLTWGSCEASPFDGANVRDYGREFGGDLDKFSAPQPRSYRRSLFLEAWERWGWMAFTHKSGKPWPVAGDIAILYPLMRLAKHPTPISDILYAVDRNGPSHDKHPRAVRAGIIQQAQGLT